MLRLVNIKKNYEMKNQEPVRALRGVSVNFRRNEFVAVLVFALIHFDFTASDIIGELWSLPSYIACGAVLTVAYIHRGPACSMTAHIVYNTIAMLMVVLAGIVDGL